MVAEEIYSVSAELIVAIMGVETKFVRNSGDYKVIDSLVTLAFNYSRKR